ncbi:MAG: molybdopterin-guanine dinucleotide biosynthesis protein B [Thermoanaerobaculia bacterium]|nr:molybdopterin-guanine dinucleotide biosynthesis protein B [Thermoanaerobaculia bacterium]
MRTILGIIGFSNSGKTSLAVELARRFSERGERVAYVKHTHHAVGSLGDGGDTRRVLDAGASVVIVADEEEAIRWQRGGAREGPDPYDDPAALVDSIDADRILVEGWKDLRLWPVLLVERAGQETMRPINGVSAVVSDGGESLDVPRFAPADLDAIVRFVDKLGGS